MAGGARGLAGRAARGRGSVQSTLHAVLGMKSGDNPFWMDQRTAPTLETLTGNTLVLTGHGRSNSGPYQ